MKQAVKQDVKRWRVLARVRGLRVRRRLRVLVEARRRETQAAAALSEQEAKLQQHARQRLQVLAFCDDERATRAGPRAGSLSRATLRAHDDGLPGLHRHREDARLRHALARDEAASMLRDWQIARIRHDDAKRRLRIAILAARR